MARNGTSAQEPQATKWPESLPLRDEKHIISVSCGNTSVLWCIHDCEDNKFKPLCCWRTTHVTDEEIKLGGPTKALASVLPESPHDIIFGPGRKGDDVTKGTALDHSKLRKIPVLTVYILSTNEDQTNKVQTLFSEIPSRIYLLQSDDFFTEEDGRYENMGADRLAALLAVGSMVGFPALVIDGGTCMVYSAAGQGRRIIGGGITLGVESRLEMLSYKTKNSPGMKHLTGEKLLNNALKLSKKKGPFDIFAKDTETSISVNLLMELTLTYRHTIKTYLKSTDAGKSAASKNGDSDKDKPKVVIAGGSADLLRTILHPDYDGIAPDPSIPPYELHTVRHLLAYGVGYALEQQSLLRKQQPLDPLDQALLGKRVAKKFPQKDEDGNNIYRGTITTAVREPKKSELSYVVKFDDNDSEELSLVDLYNAVKLFASVGEKMKGKGHSEAMKKMLAEKVRDANAAATVLEKHNKVKSVQDQKMPARPKEPAQQQRKQPPQQQPQPQKRAHSSVASSTPKSSSKTPPQKKQKKEKGPQDYVGARIAKFFDEALYFGDITGYDDGYWKVVYTDGDCEEFDEADLKTAVKLYTKHKSSDRR